MFAIVCTQNHMNAQDVLKECVPEKWIPILVMRPDGGKCIVPLFQDANVARRFAQRNLPKDWKCGLINLQLEDGEWMDSKGWESILYEYPRNVKDLTDFDVEILEFDPEREMVVHV